MFSLLKMVSSLVGIVIIGLVVLYFLPHDIKLKVLEKISDITPASISDPVEDLVLTPPEERDKLLTKLETNLDKLKDASGSEETTLLSQSKLLLDKLRAKNEEQSLTEIAKDKIAAGLIAGNLCKDNSATSTAN